MYCKKCGKFIDYDAPICNECLEAEKLSQQAEQTVNLDFGYTDDNSTSENLFDDNQSRSANVNHTEGKVMDGFGIALTSVILSIFAVSFVLYAFSSVILLIDESALITTEDAEILFISAITLIVISIALAVASIIMGVISIKRYKQAKLLNRKRPIPAFIMGIYSVIESSSSLILALSVLMMLI